MTVFLDWRFLKVAKRSKNLAGLSLFALILWEPRRGRLRKQAFTHFGDTVAVVCRFAHKS